MRSRPTSVSVRYLLMRRTNPSLPVSLDSLAAVSRSNARVSVLSTLCLLVIGTEHLLWYDSGLATLAPPSLPKRVDKGYLSRRPQAFGADAAG